MFRVPRLVSVGVAVTLILTACQSGTAGAPESVVSPPSSSQAQPSPSAPSASGSTGEAAKARNIAAAKQRYLEFQEITTTNSRKGQSPFRDLINGGYIGSSELRKSEQSFWEQYIELDLKQVGEPGIEVVEVTKYDGDPLNQDVTGQRVHMTVCIDNEGTDVVRPDGSSALDKASLKRGLMKVTMQGQQDGLWSVNENASTGKEC